MSMISVNSSNLASVGYHDSNQSLYVQFNDGSLYTYHNVPKDLYTGLLNAPSKGSFLHTYVKGNYGYSKS